MHRFNRGRNLGAVLMFFFDGSGKIGIGRSQREVQCLPPDPEITFQLCKLLLLCLIKIELFVNEAVDPNILVVALAPVFGTEGTDPACAKRQQDEKDNL